MGGPPGIFSTMIGSIVTFVGGKESTLGFPLARVSAFIDEMDLWEVLMDETTKMKTWYWELWGSFTQGTLHKRIYQQTIGNVQQAYTQVKDPQINAGGRFSACVIAVLLVIELIIQAAVIIFTKLGLVGFPFGSIENPTKK